MLWSLHELLVLCLCEFAHLPESHPWSLEAGWMDTQVSCTAFVDSRVTSQVYVSKRVLKAVHLALPILIL